MKKLIKKLLGMLFPAKPSPRIMLDDDLAFFGNTAYADDKRPDAGAIAAAQVIAMRIKDGTLYGAKPDTNGVRRGRELDRKSALVAQCDKQNAACPGCYLPWKKGPPAQA